MGEGHYACLVDAAHTPVTDGPFSLEAFLQRDHILISSAGFVGVVDELLAAMGRQRRIVASTSHFSAIPHLLRASAAVATLPRHAAVAIAAQTGLQMWPCPLAMPRYPVELGWRTDALRDAAVMEVRRVIAVLLCAFSWE